MAPGYARQTPRKDTVNRDILPPKSPGGDRAAIENDRREIESRYRHYRTGYGLVAAHQDDESIEVIAARNQLNRVSDNLTAHQRSTHALCAHGDAIRDGNGVELHRRSAGFAHALLHG